MNSTDVAPEWRKARRSTGNGACVEVAAHGKQVKVRDSKAPDAGVLFFGPAAWWSFLAAMRDDG